MISSALVGLVTNKLLYSICEAMEIGKIYFYTASILNWKTVLIKEEPKRIVLESLSFLTKDESVQILAFVIMPNHIHLIWKPLKDNLQLRFMKFTAQKLKFWINDHHPELLPHFLVNKKDRTFQIWQRNPQAKELYSPEVLEQKLDYIHNNPCQGKWMLSKDPISYLWSSAAFYEEDDGRYSFLEHYKEFI